MFKSHYWSASLFLVTGIVLGWLLNDLVEPAPDGATGLATDVTMEPDLVRQDPPLHDQQSSVTEIDTKARSDDPLPDVLSPERIGSTQNDSAPADLPKDPKCLPSDLRPECRSELVMFAQSQASRTARIRRISEWFSEYPEDLDMGLMLVTQLVEDRQYDRGIDTLRAVGSYQTDLTESARLATFVKRMLRTDAQRYRTNNKLGALKVLYDILIGSEPQNPRWRYEQAEILFEMGQHQSALGVLGYILYDPEFGESAVKLSAEIRDTDRLSTLAEVPYARKGSQYLVEAILNGNRKVTLLIDTGASITSLRGAVIGEPGVARDTGITADLNTAGGIINAPLSRLSSIDVGGQVVAGMEVASIELAGDHLDGLLGLDFLDRFHFTLDHSKRVLRLEKKTR